MQILICIILVVGICLEIGGFPLKIIIPLHRSKSNTNENTFAMLPYLSSKTSQRRTDIFKIWARRKKEIDPNEPLPSLKKPRKNKEATSDPVIDNNSLPDMASENAGRGISPDFKVSPIVEPLVDTKQPLQKNSSKKSSPKTKSKSIDEQLVAIEKKSTDILPKITSKKGSSKTKSKPGTEPIASDEQHLPKLEIKPVDPSEVILTPSTKTSKPKSTRLPNNGIPSSVTSLDSIDIDDEVALLDQELSVKNDLVDLGSLDETFNMGLLEDDFDLRDMLGELGMTNLEDDFAKLEATLNLDDFIFSDTIKQPLTPADNIDSFTDDYMPVRSARNGAASPTSTLTRGTDNIEDFLQMDDINIYKKRDKSLDKLKIKRTQDTFDHFDDDDEDEEEKNEEVLESDLEEVLGLGEILGRNSELDDDDRERFEDDDELLSFVLDDDSSLKDDDDDDDEEEDDEEDIIPAPVAAIKAAANAKSSPPAMKIKSKPKPEAAIKEEDAEGIEFEGFEPIGKDDEAALVVGGVELDKKEFALGQVPPPLEEFRRLMEALGGEADSMFGSEEFEGGGSRPGAPRRRKSSPAKEFSVDEDSEAEEEDRDSDSDLFPRIREIDVDLTDPDIMPWLPDVYAGGVPNESVFVSEKSKSSAKRVKELGVDDADNDDESQDESFLDMYPPQLHKDPPPFSSSFFAEAYNELYRPISEDDDDDTTLLPSTPPVSRPTTTNPSSSSKKGSKKRVTSKITNPSVSITETNEEMKAVMEAAAEEGVDLEDDLYSDDDDEGEEGEAGDILFEDVAGYGNTEIVSENIPDASDMSSSEWWAGYEDRPTDWRLLVVSVVTNSTKNNTALSLVETVTDYIKEKTDNDPRINYQTIVYAGENDDTPVKELEDNIQMWCEGYNTYHLIDGAAMKEVWGGIMPNIILSPKNLNAIVEQVAWALEEDDLDGVLLTPRLRRLRLRGGAQEMIMGFNTEFLDSEFSVVSVR